MNFQGKRVLITGGAQGLGRATAQKFHDAGATVAVLDKDVEALRKLSTDLPEVTVAQVDLLDWEATRMSMEKMEAFDILVNNAGIAQIAPFMDIKEEDVDLIFGINFKAALNVAQIFSKRVIAAEIKGASIVNVSSVLDRKCFPGALSYSCTKAALTMMTKCMAKELGPHGIRVNCIRPTAMRTNLIEAVKDAVGTFENFSAGFIAVAPIKRVPEPSEAADLILFLSSPPAALITGEDVSIDAGFSIA